MGSCYSHQAKNTQRVGSTADMPHPITQSSTSLTSNGSSGGGAQTAAMATSKQSQDGASARSFGFTKPYGGRYSKNAKGAHHSNQQSAGAKGAAGTGNERMTLGTLSDSPKRSAPQASAPYTKSKPVSALGRFGFKAPASKLKAETKNKVSRSSDSLQSSPSSAAGRVKKAESSGSLNSEKTRGLRIRYSAFTPNDEDAWRMIDDESRSTSLKSGSTQDNKSNNVAKATDCAIDNPSRDINEDDIKNANVDTSSNTSMDKTTVVSEGTIQASTHSSTEHSMIYSSSRTKSNSSARNSYGSSKLQGPGSVSGSSRLSSSSNMRGPLAKFANNHYGQGTGRGWVKASSTDSEPQSLSAPGKKETPVKVEPAMANKKVVTVESVKTESSLPTVAIKSESKVTTKKGEAKSETLVVGKTQETKDQKAVSSSGSGSKKVSQKEMKDNGEKGSKKESTPNLVKKGTSFLRRGLLRKQKSVPEKSSPSPELRSAPSETKPDNAPAPASLSTPAPSSLSAPAPDEVDAGRSSTTSNDEVFTKEEMRTTTNGVLSAVPPTVAPLAMIESMEATSIGSLDSDDLMLDLDLPLEEHDYEERDLPRQPRSRSNSGRLKMRLRSRSQSNDDLDEPEKKPSVLLRRHTEGGPVQRQDSTKRNSGGGKRGSGSQAEALDELASLLDNNPPIRRNPHVSKANRPSSFPGPRHSHSRPLETEESSAAHHQVVLRPPRQTPSIGDEEQVMMDGFTYRQLMQDITMYKTMLLKLKRVIQEDEIGTPWKQNGLLFGGSQPNSPCRDDSYKPCLGESPTSPHGEHHGKLDDVLRENQELRDQLQALSHQAEEHDRTIKLLQHQMTKYECGHLGPGGKVFSNAGVQTDKPPPPRIARYDGRGKAPPSAGKKAPVAPSSEANRPRTELRPCQAPSSRNKLTKTKPIDDIKPGAAPEGSTRSHVTRDVTPRVTNQKPDATVTMETAPADSNLNTTFTLPTDTSLNDTVDGDENKNTTPNSDQPDSTALNNNPAIVVYKMSDAPPVDIMLKSTDEKDRNFNEKPMNTEPKMDAEAMTQVVIEKEKTKVRVIPPARKTPVRTSGASGLPRASKLPGIKIQKYTRTESQKLKSFSNMTKPT